MRLPGSSPDSSLVEPPSSTETLYPNSQFQYNEFQYGVGSQFPSSFHQTTTKTELFAHNSFDEFVDSTTSFTENQDINIHTGLKVPSVTGATCLPPELGSPDRTVLTIKQEINNQTSIDPVFVDSTTYPGRPTPPLQQHHDDPLDNLENDPERFRQHLSETVLSAHTLTCLMDQAQIQALSAQPHDNIRIQQFKNKSTEELWMESEQKLTDVITQIIEFAKMLPGFQKFPQDDRIVLLKAGSFELALLRMSRYYSVSRRSVLFGDTMMPMEAFMTSSNTLEMMLVQQIFEFVRSISELELSETALALYSAYILLQHDRAGLRNVDDIRTVGSTILTTLETELNSSSSFTLLNNPNSIFQQLVNKRHTLRELSRSHLEVLTRFKRSCRNKLQFPPLHGEIFPDS